MQKVGNVIKEFLVPEIRLKEPHLLVKMYSCKNNFGERYELNNNA